MIPKLLVALALGATLSLAGHEVTATERPLARRTTFDYGLGIGVLQLRDDVLRPLRWTGVVGSVALALDVERPGWLHGADAELGFGVLWNRYGHQGMVITQGAHYALGREVHATGRVKLFVGAAYRYESLDAYYFDWDDSFLYWFTTHSLAPAVAFETEPSQKTRLFASFELPLFGLLSRAKSTHAYKVDPLPYLWRWPGLANGRLVPVGPSDLFAPTLVLLLDRQLGAHLGLRLRLDVSYRRALEPRGYYALGERALAELRHVF